MEDAELCLGLGLPGGNKAATGGKRGFTETESATPPPLDLKLKLQTTTGSAEPANQSSEKTKRGAVSEKNSETTARPPASKAQVVGWPPVRSYRKNVLTSNTEKDKGEDEKSAAFVKVSMDGAPYLRKVDLKMYSGYKELSKALEKMFGSFNTEFVVTYEDKDGDWMLVGDLPFGMFVDSCKRLRVMKGSDAMELAPRATEKRNNNRGEKA